MDGRGLRKKKQRLMRYEYTDAKARIRKAAAIGLNEISDRTKTRELVTELAMISGYIGYIDVEEFGVRVYVFTDAESAEKMIKEAKKIGFRTAGEVEGTIVIKNTELERPHLKYMPKKAFLKELYK